MRNVKPLLDIKTEPCSQIEGKNPTLEVRSLHVVGLGRNLRDAPDQEEKRLNPDHGDLQADSPRHLIIPSGPALFKYKTCHIRSQYQLNEI